MYHTFAYEELVATTDDTDLDAIRDDVLIVQNDHFLPQADLQLLWAFACAADLNRAKIVTPSFRQVSPPFIRPIEGAAAPGDNCPVADYRDNPLIIPGLAEVAIEASSDTATTDQTYVVLGASDRGITPVPRGDVFTMRGVSTTAAVASTWTTLAMSWADTLPPGRFAVVGMELIGAGNIAGRLILENQIWRPGCIAGTDVQNRGPAMFRKGRLGSWGTFRATALPQVQVLCNTTTASHTAYIDLVRLAA